jgi:hypothetical protein
MPNPAWVSLGNVVSHMGVHATHDASRVKENAFEPCMLKAHVSHDDSMPMCKSRTQLYAPQTKILEGRTNFSECGFEALFKGVSTVFGLQNVEKMLRNRVLKSSSDLPKSLFGRGKLSSHKMLIACRCVCPTQTFMSSVNSQDDDSMMNQMSLMIA